MTASTNPVQDPATALSASSRMAMKRAHLALLHGVAGGGQVCLSREAPELEAGWEDTLVWQGRAAESEALATAEFIGMNTFRFRRGGEYVHQVGHLFGDCDYRGSYPDGRSLPYAHLSEDEVIDLINQVCETAGISVPSFDTASGNGIHPVWVCDRLQASAQHKVALTMKALFGPVLRPDGKVPVRRRRDPDRDAHEARMLPLWTLWRDLGLDRGVRDPARVLRLWGSINPKNGATCRLAWPSSIEDIVRYDFNDLSDRILPLTRWQLKARIAERAAWREANPEAAKAHAAGQRHAPAGRWARIAQDLVRLRDLRDGMPKGLRHLWVFLTANARAHACGGSKKDWAAELGAMVGLSEADAMSCLSTLDKRAQRHAVGETDDYAGRAVTPLYHYSPARMCDDLAITEAEGEAMLVLVPGGAAHRTAAERQADKRVRDGATPRAIRVSSRIEDGRRAVTMRAEGRTMAEVCETLGRCESSVRKAMREAAENVVETIVETTPNSTASTVPDQLDPSRYIGPLASRAPCRTPAEILFDRPRITRNSGTSWEYRFGPETYTIVYRNPDSLHGWSALSSTGGDAEIPAGFLDERRAEKARRRLRTLSQPHAARPNRFPARTPVARPTAPSAPALTADEYRRISQGW
jgi:hypothetical protein